MNQRNTNLIIGLILIIAGGLFLAQNLNWIGNFAPLVWAGLFVAASLFFFFLFFARGRNQWGWLFPAFILAGVALTIFLDERGVDGPWPAVPVLVGSILPFLFVFLFNREHWWALIPAWVMLAVTGIVIFAERVPGEFIATGILLAIALPFLVVYLVDRSHWWALIPFGVMTVVGMIPWLTTVADEDLVGALIMFLFAFPFVVVFVASPKNWWAIIPAGVLASIGVVVLIAEGTTLSGGREAAWINAALFLGFAITFGILWLLRATHPTAWARWPAMILGAMGLLALVLGVNIALLGPVMLIAGGAALLYFGFRPKKVE